MRRRRRGDSEESATPEQIKALDAAYPKKNDNDLSGWEEVKNPTTLAGKAIGVEISDNTVHSAFFPIPASPGPGPQKVYKVTGDDMPSDVKEAILKNQEVRSFTPGEHKKRNQSQGRG